MLDPGAERAHKASNLFQTVVMLAGIGGMLAVSTALLWGWSGLIGTGAALLILALFAPRLPPSVVMRLYNGQLVDRRSDGQLTRIVDALSARAQLEPVPELYIIPSMTLNAFATGSRRNAAIGITEGLLRKLSMRELTGVLAHEISHIKNNDLWVMGLADLMSRFTQILSYLAALLAAINVLAMLVDGEAAYSWVAIIVLYLAPALSNLLQLGLSRTREFDADLEGARLTGDPEGLASALHKVERYTGHFWEDLMLPVPARRVPQPSVLRSHPTTEQRIARLRELDPRSALPQIIIVDEPMISMVGFGPISMRPRYRFPGLWY
jgi:heat shock protein HtpX